MSGVRGRASAPAEPAEPRSTRPKREASWRNLPADYADYVSYELGGGSERSGSGGIFKSAAVAILRQASVASGWLCLYITGNMYDLRVKPAYGRSPHCVQQSLHAVHPVNCVRHVAVAFCRSAV